MNVEIGDISSFEEPQTNSYKKTTFILIWITLALIPQATIM